VPSFCLSDQGRANQTEKPLSSVSFTIYTGITPRGGLARACHTEQLYGLIENASRCHTEVTS